MAAYPAPGPFIKKIRLRTALYKLIVFLAMQSIGTISDGNPEAHARLCGFTDFFKANVITISLALAGMVTILIGAIFQTVA